MSSARDEANKIAFQRLVSAEPVLVDVRPALEVIPGMRKHLVLASGPPAPWADYTGLLQRAIFNGALYEGLASSHEEAARRFDAGELAVEALQTHSATGASTGVTTASMQVYVVENRAGGNRSYCTLVESNPPRVFVNGCWGDDVRERLDFVNKVVAPVLGAAARSAGGIPLKPIMRRALGMGDEMHTRNDAGTQLFLNALVPSLLEVAGEMKEEVRQTVRFLHGNTVAFIRLVLAAAKATLDAAHGVERSSMVTGMVNNIKEFGIRVSGLGDEWFRGPHADFLGKYFPGSSREDEVHAGAESWNTEAIGLGGFAQAAALALPFRGTVEDTVERNRKMYDITIGVNNEFKIPYFDRGTPTGIDIVKVMRTGIRPFLSGGVMRRDGEGVAGVGPLVASPGPFEAAMAAYTRRYGAD
jgi:hypothetical protein